MANTLGEAFGIAGPAPSWYHGDVSRGVAEAQLKGAPPGIFFVRDSSSSEGDFVMSVSEADRVSHYIIQRKGKNIYRMGDRDFFDLVEIIDFYKTHLLDCTTLSVPLPLEGKLSKATMITDGVLFAVRAMYNFNAKDPEDLTFRKGDMLNVLSQHEPQWWRAQSQKTLQIGCVPINYIGRLDANGRPAPVVSRDGKLSRSGSVMDSSSNSGRSLPPIPQDDDDEPPPLPAAHSRGGAAGGSMRRSLPPPPPPEDDDVPPPALPQRPAVPAPAPVQRPAVPAPAPVAIPSRPPPLPPAAVPVSIISHPPPPKPAPEPVVATTLMPALPLNAKGEMPAERPKFIVARATIDRVAHAYDRTQLSFKAGDCIQVLKQNENGLWKGAIVGGDGKEGYFPFTLVELLDCAEYDDDIGSLEKQFNIQMDAIYGTN